MLPSQLAKQPNSSVSVEVPVEGHLLLTPSSEVTVVGERQLPRTRGNGQSNNHLSFLHPLNFFVSPERLYNLLTNETVVWVAILKQRVHE